MRIGLSGYNSVSNLTSEFKLAELERSASLKSLRALLYVYCSKEMSRLKFFEITNF